MHQALLDDLEKEQAAADRIRPADTDGVALSAWLRFDDPKLERSFQLQRFHDSRMVIIVQWAALTLVTFFNISDTTIAVDNTGLVVINVFFLCAMFALRRFGFLLHIGFMVLWLAEMAVFMSSADLSDRQSRALAVVLPYWGPTGLVMCATPFFIAAWLIPLLAGVSLWSGLRSGGPVAIVLAEGRACPDVYTYVAVIWVVLLICHLRNSELQMRRLYAASVCLRRANVQLEFLADPFSFGALSSWFAEKRAAADYDAVSTSTAASSLGSGSGSGSGSGFASGHGGGELDLPGTSHHTSPWDIDFEELQLSQLIAAGGSGRVFDGAYNGVRVAIKELYQTIISNDQLSEFASEVGALSQMRHPNVVFLLGICYHDSRLFMVTEFLPHELTHVLMEDADQAPPALCLTQQLTAGCRYIHSKGFIHRDLKPQNVMLSDSWQLKIVDLGLARLVNSGTHYTGIGTPHFMAPELFHQDLVADATKLDVYAWAVTVWSIFTRELPYPGLEFAQICIGVLQTDLRPPTEGLPEWLTALLEACWHKDPLQRPSFDEVFAQLPSQP